MPETLLPEPTTLVGLAMAVSLVLAATLMLMRLRYPADIRGTGYWALGPALWCLASALISQHGHWPTSLTQGGGSILVAAGTLAYYLGARDFYRRRTRWPTYALLALLLLALLGSREETGYLLRVCAVYMAVDALNLRILLRHGNRGFPVRLIQAAFLVHLLALAARFVQLAQGGEFRDFLAPSPFNSLYVGTYVFALLALGMGAIVMAMERLSGDLRHQATHDPLTRVLHRGALMQACAQELDRSRRSGQGPTLMMFDLDHFKKINDTRGHPYGDRVLAHCARRAKEQLRQADLLGRYGGEEFMVLLPATHLAEAEHVARRIRAAVSEDHPLRCTVSIGAAAWRGPQDTLDAMIARADRALYQAKSQGRDRTCAA